MILIGYALPASQDGYTQISYLAPWSTEIPVSLDDEMEKYATRGVAINQAGFIAARKGRAQDSNPFSADYWEGEAWLQGWHAGRHDELGQGEPE